MKGAFLKRSKLSWKLAIIYASIFSVILFTLNAGVLYGIHLFLISQAAAEINDISKTIAGDIVGSPTEQTPLTDPELVNDVGGNAEVGVRIATPDGIEVNKSSNMSVNGPVLTDNLGKIRQMKIDGGNIILENTRVESNGSTVAYLQVLSNMNREYGFTRALLLLMIAANVIGIVLSLFAGFLTSKRMLSPIDKLTNTVQEIDIQDLDTHVEEGKADDELSRLAKTFNKMLDRLRLSFEKQNQFVSDASHELRTPIAVIRGYADLLGKWGKGNPAIFDESVQAIRGETAEMTELLEKLLLLAKSDNKMIDLKKTVFPLSNLIEEVAAESRLISPSHAITFVCDAPVEVYADRLMLKQALRALVENSSKFTAAGGSIDLGYAVKGHSVAITVRDTGIGVPEEQIGNIFERFYRVDKSRSKETGGSGLGLSIVQLIVKAHDGTVAANNRPGKGMEICMTLPLA